MNLSHLLVVAGLAAFPGSGGLAATFEITSPIAGQQVRQNSTLTVTWNPAGYAGSVSISMSVGADDVPSKIADVPATNGSASFFIENAGRFNGDGFDVRKSPTGPVLQTYYDASDRVRIYINGPSSSTFEEGVEAITEYFTISEPIVELLNPRSGDTFAIGDVISIRWRTQGLSYPHVAIGISSDGGQTWQESMTYLDDTGQAKLEVCASFTGVPGVFDLNLPRSADDFTLGYFESLPFGRKYKIRLRAGLSSGSAETEGNFSVLPAGTTQVTRQSIKGRVGSRVHARVRNLEGRSSYKHALPKGLKFKPASHWIVGRPRQAMRKTVRFITKSGDETIVKFIIRKKTSQVSGRL